MEKILLMRACREAGPTPDFAFSRTIAVLLAVILTAITAPSSFALDTEQFIRDSSIQYEKHFTVGTSLERWQRILDNPTLMSELWCLYDCKPHYRIESKEGKYTIVDPTGIQGSLSLIALSPVQRTYFGKGKMKNWFIPISLKGSALFFVESFQENDGVTVRFRVYGEGGDDLFTRMLLKAVSPVLTSYIDRRVTRNVADLSRIVDDMEKKPDEVTKSLSEPLRGQYNLLLHGVSLPR